MTKYKILVSVVSIIIAGLAIASSGDIAERIKRVGDVCIEGADCASASAPTMVAASGGASVEANFNKSCATCHNSGVAGAPKYGDSLAWAPRIEKGIEVSREITKREAEISKRWEYDIKYGMGGRPAMPAWPAGQISF